MNHPDKNIILVELDFPRRKKLEPNILNQNRELARIFGVTGYPTCWLVKPQIFENNAHQNACSFGKTFTLGFYIKLQKPSTRPAQN